MSYHYLLGYYTEAESALSGEIFRNCMLLTGASAVALVTVKPAEPSPDRRLPVQLLDDMKIPEQYQMMPIDAVVSYLDDGRQVIATFDCALNSQLFEAAGCIPIEVSGGCCQLDVSICAGRHNIEDWDVSTQQSRGWHWASLSFEFMGRGLPRSPVQFVDEIRRLPAMRQLRESIESIAGPMLEFAHV